MGNQVCCVQKRLEFHIDCFTEHSGLHSVESHGAGGSPWGQSPSPVPSSAARPSSPRSGFYPENDFAAEVAQLIATDRKQQLYEAASLIPVFYAVKSPEPDEAQHTATAVHRKTGVARQLSSFRKPRGAGAQERLHSFVSSLQVISADSEAIAKVFEVFEDYMNVHVLLEQCTGGTVYERILERQYFTEQESAVLIKHMLEALLPFHENHLYHGSISPDSFRFLNNSPHAPLKMVDFGVDLKVHRWDAVDSDAGGGADLQNPNCSQFFETCKLVFCAPEFAPPYQRKRRGPLALIADSQDLKQASGSKAAGSNGNSLSGQEDGGLLDGELLADVIDGHADFFEQQQQDVAGGYHRKFEAGDIWSVGAIAFLLLCGYPPFFAPSRNAILGRIHRTEYSFDPPFWSKISEEAKNFVHSCIRESCWDRMSVHQALQHPWIQRLADTSPSGSMFSSFMLNLRRFYRTSLIEMYVANVLANKFQRQDMQDFLRRCREIDTCNTGFFTASDLKHVLSALGHGCIADAITSRFLRAFRHPGESYIDYIAMLDSIHLRQQRIFEEALWFHFQRICQSSGRGGSTNGMISLDELSMLFSDPIIVGLLMREIPESSGAEEATVSQQLQSSIRTHCSENGTAQVEFRDLSSLLRSVARAYPTAMQMPELMQAEAPNPIEAVSL